MPTFARPVPAITTKLVTPALGVELAVLEQEKQLCVLQRLIVFVHKMCVHVPTVYKPPELLVLHMVPTFARPVPADTTKLVTPALDVDLLAVPEQDLLLVRQQQIERV